MNNDTPVKEIKRRHRNPSVKQIKALQLIANGYSKRKAMLEAGYSLSTANNKPHLVTRSKVAFQIMESMKDALSHSPVLTGEYMAKKFEKWMEAQKNDKDDYKTQLAAFQQFKDVVEPKDGTGLKRKITFEEFIGEDENKLPEVD